MDIEKYKADCAKVGIIAQPPTQKPDMLKPFTPKENAAALNESATLEADRREMQSWQIEGDLARLDPPGDLAARIRAFETKGHELETEAARLGR